MHSKYYYDKLKNSNNNIRTYTVDMNLEEISTISGILLSELRRLNNCDQISILWLMSYMKRYNTRSINKFILNK